MNKTTKQKDWEAQIKQAQSRPAMYIGGQKTAHESAISSCLGLVRKAKAFNNLLSVTVYLAPTQYVVLCEAGKLLDEIEKIYTWEDKYVLMEDWPSIDEGLRGEHRVVTLTTESDESLPEWRRLFGSPSGPTLNSATYPAILARRFIVAYRLSNGYWCQGFRHGRPETAPFRIQASFPVSLLVAADLDPNWFTGLPYTVDDVEKIASMPSVKAIWHPTNDLLMNELSARRELAQWLSS